MVSTRRTTRANSMNDNEQTPLKPLKPLPEPSSILNVFLILGLNICKKIVLCNTYLRVLVYLVGLFALSGIADVLTIPKFYTNHFLNNYFVKLGWFWTLLVAIPFVSMTSYTYCCGKTSLLLKHLARLGVATFFWYFWVNLFVYIEKIYGYCVEKRDLTSKMACVSSGSTWKGFDVSGHAFILIYSNLVLIEESRPILGWEGIRDLIRDENHTRDHKIADFTPLRNLSTSEFDKLQNLYVKFLPFVRLNFVLITSLSVIWDYMLLSTILYFHSMPEKLLSGVIAIILWYSTYKIWYRIKGLTPSYPGEGTFTYYTSANQNQRNAKNRTDR